MAERRIASQLFDGTDSFVAVFPNVLPPDEVVRLRRMAEARGDAGIGLYSDPATSQSGIDMGEFFVDWPQSLKMRADIGPTSMFHGGRFDLQKRQQKGGQFRMTLSGYQRETEEGVHALLQHEPFHAAARDMLHGERPLIDPAVAFGNFMVPGEVQGVHTDVPEFRGCNRNNVPEWLLVCMHHSGLFDRFRIPIITSITWLSDNEGGELAMYPDPSKPGVAHPTPSNSAVILETDAVWHGVDSVGSRDLAPPVIPDGSLLRHRGDGRWAVELPSGEYLEGMEDMSWSDVRFSIQWKAYCWRDEAERQMAAEHTDDVDGETAFKTLLEEFRRRRGETLEEASLAAQVSALCVEFIGDHVPAELRQVHTEEPAAVSAAGVAGRSRL